MKRFKISLLALAAIVVGIGTSAFTQQPRHAAGDIEWYFYDGEGPLDDESNYFYTDGSAPACNSTASGLCAILVEGDGTNPDATALDALYTNNADFVLPVENLVKMKSN